jgi:hypothetical protein
MCRLGLLTKRKRDRGKIVEYVKADMYVNGNTVFPAGCKPVGVLVARQCC